MGPMDDLHAKWAKEDAEKDQRRAELTKTITALVGIALRIAIVLTVASLVLGWVEDRWEGVLIAVTVGAASWLGLFAVFALVAWLQRDSV